MPKVHKYHEIVRHGVFDSKLVLISEGLTTSCASTKGDTESGTPSLLKAQLLQHQHEAMGGGDVVYFATSKNVQHQSNIGLDDTNEQQRHNSRQGMCTLEIILVFIK